MNCFKIEQKGGLLLYDYSNLQANSKIDISHSTRVARLCNMLCSSLNINEKIKEIIIISAMLHDIGKVKIDSHLLNKKGSLTSEEWSKIKKHPIYGYTLVKNMGYEDNICKAILYHHENYDGTGYPKGIKGSKIPLGAGIIRICDSYDAMRSIRSYKKSMDHEGAINELIKTKNIYREDLLNKFLKADFDVIERLYDNKF